MRQRPRKLLHIVKVVSVILILGTTMVATSSQPSAGHTSSTYYISPWNFNVLDWQLGRLQTLDTQDGRFRIRGGIRSWEFSDSTPTNFDWDEEAQDPTLNYTKYTLCDLDPPPFVHDALLVARTWDGLGGNPAVTIDCVRGGVKTKVVVIFDTQDRWYTSAGGTVPADTWDLQATAAHEGGHLTGWAAHFTGSSMCPNTSAIQTMCQGARGTMWKRTLEVHDVHTWQNAY